MDRQAIKEWAESRPFSQRSDTWCGAGSTIERTASLRNELPRLIEKYGPRVNDAGCGDGRWIASVGIEDYQGYDIVRYDEWGVGQQQIDITKDLMIPCDLIICRDVFIHLPLEFVQDALKLFKESGKFLLAPSYEGAKNDWAHNSRQHPIDLSKEPFNLHCVWRMEDPQNGHGRYMGVWTL